MNREIPQDVGKAVVESVVLRHYDDRYAPPYEDIMQVSLIAGDMVFLSVGEFEETNEHQEFVPKTTFGITLVNLRRVLDFLEASS